MMNKKRKELTDKEKISITKKVGKMPILYKLLKHCKVVYKKYNVVLGNKSMERRILDVMGQTETNVVDYLNWWERYFNGLDNK